MGQPRKRSSHSDPPARPDRSSSERREELAAARRRAIVAKAGAVGAVAVVFAGGMSLARHAYPGHAKQPVQPLSAPAEYQSIVRKNLLQAGVVGPAKAPPGAATAAS